jgi:hypothetical protein
MATIKKAQSGMKAAPKKIAGEMTGKMYKKSAIDKIGDKQAAELDKVSIFGKEAMKKKAAGKAKDGKWIQKAIKKPGALRAQLGAKPGKPIPAAKLAKAAKAKGKLGQRARLAMTLKKMKK